MMVKASHDTALHEMLGNQLLADVPEGFLSYGCLLHQGLSSHLILCSYSHGDFQ